MPNVESWIKGDAKAADDGWSVRSLGIRLVQEGDHVARGATMGVKRLARGRKGEWKRSALPEDTAG